MINLKSSRLLRLVTLVILTFVFNQARAQVQTPRYISMTSNTNGFYEYLPQGYDPNSSTTYPVIIFFHGVGELGSGNQWELPRILYTGLPGIINNGQFPASFNVNGQNHKFIVISPQFINWPSPADADQVINYVISHYKVNTNRIYLTGLSMGGGVVWDYCGASVANGSRVAAIVPICGASWPDPARGRTIASANIPVWAIHNNQDPTVGVSYTNGYIDIINQAPAPNPLAKKSLYDVWSHDAWTNAYNQTDRDETGKSIFEWMLQFARNAAPPAPSNQLPVAKAGADQNISGSTAQLNGSGSDVDGYVTSYTWTQVSGPSTASFSNAGIANPSVNNLIAGSYTFRLTVRDNVSASGIDDIVVNVASAPAAPASIPGRIQGEGYSSMNGIQLENTSDAGGGQNVAWQDNNDWMDYSVNVTATGVYTVNFRVATMFSGAQFQLRKADGTTLATVTVPNTGNFQSWQSVSATVNLSAGQQSLRIYTTQANGGWNFNWMEFAQAATANQLPTVSAGSTQTVALPASSATLTGTASDADGWIASYFWSQVSGPSTASISNSGSASTGVNSLVQGSYVFRLKATDNTGASSTSDVTVNVSGSTSITNLRIQAENYSSMYGIQTENTSDAGGGQNVAWQDNNDWMDYAVNIAASGTYTVNFRVASMFSGAQFQLRNSSGSVLATVTVPNTGNFQSWQNVSASVSLPAGSQTLRIVTTQANGGWNINWFELAGVSAPAPNPYLPTSKYRVKAIHPCMVSRQKTLLMQAADKT
jgi:predicted esterase